MLDVAAVVNVKLRAAEVPAIETGVAPKRFRRLRRNHVHRLPTTVTHVLLKRRPFVSSHRSAAFELLVISEKRLVFQVKRLIVNPGGVLSLQKHAHRAEHWVVVRGRARITKNDDEFDLGVNESVYIAIGDIHRIANPFDEPVHIIEVQCGDYLGEDDIVRLEDNYGREGTNT